MQQNVSTSLNLIEKAFLLLFAEIVSTIKMKPFFFPTISQIFHARLPNSNPSNCEKRMAFLANFFFLNIRCRPMFASFINGSKSKMQIKLKFFCSKNPNFQPSAKLVLFSMNLGWTYLNLKTPCSIGYFSLSVTNRQEKLKANFCLSSQDCSSEILTTTHSQYPDESLKRSSNQWKRRR